MNTIRFYCVSKAESPITHMSGTVGNQAIVAREPVQTQAGVRWVPVLSGNCIRHQIREHGFLHLIQAWGLEGKLRKDQLMFLLNGGANTSSGQFEDTKRLYEAEKYIPLIALLGGCLDDQILGSKLVVWRGRLICEENRKYLESDTPYSFPSERIRSVEDFLGNYQYTRGVSELVEPANLEEIDEQQQEARESGKKEKSDRMIFAGQMLTTGSLFSHGFVVKSPSKIMIGALLHSLKEWQDAGGTIGGQSSKGHGRLSLYITSDAFDSTSQQNYIDAYLENVEEYREKGIEWLEREFTKARKTRKK